MDENASIADPLKTLRERIRDLNTKAYYLLVALSFLYRATTPGPRLLKIALTLTALVAILPVQDYVKSACKLECLRFMKIVLLLAALGFTLAWLWAAAG